MGCSNSSLTKEEKEAKKRTREIELILKRHKVKIERETKILLLGAGESGKSTIFKQMKFLQDGQFDSKDQEQVKLSIPRNCVSQMQLLVIAAEKIGIPIEHEDLASQIKKIKSCDSLTPEISKIINDLWHDPGIQQVYQFRDKKFQLNDSAEYFFTNVMRFSEENYQPTPDDILRVRVKTIGIEEAEFTVKGLHFVMVDVGGQRNERRKWIHSFEGVTSVLFCCSLIGFDQTLREDSSVNRLEEAFSIFSEICSSPWFAKASVILFLNKKDLFKKKIEENDLSIVFPEYQGGKDYQKASKFIEDKFLAISSQSNQPTRHIYAFKTCAISTKNIDRVFKCVVDTALSNVLEELDMV